MENLVKVGKAGIYIMVVGGSIWVMNKFSWTAKHVTGTYEATKTYWL